MKIAVIAGTPVDTQMGVDYLHQRDAGLETVFLPCASDPRACHLFQVKSPEEKTATMRELYRSAIDMGIRYFFVYCNSLSSAVDFDTLSESMGVKTVTPMRAYEKLALDYNILGLLAANNQSTKGIEDRFTAVNPSGYVIGIGNLRLTEAVERMTPPAEIVRNLKRSSSPVRTSLILKKNSLNLPDCLFWTLPISCLKNCLPTSTKRHVTCKHEYA